MFSSSGGSIFLRRPMRWSLVSLEWAAASDSASFLRRLERSSLSSPARAATVELEFVLPQLVHCSSFLENGTRKAKMSPFFSFG